MSDSVSNKRAIDLSFLKNQEEETILRDNYLFVIGINEYQNCTPLGNAVNDARSFAKVLNEKYRFKKEHTFSLINEEATINNIDDTFKELKNKIRTETDNLVIFFCGHGYYDEEWDTAYWVPVEARADRALGEYFSHEDLMKRINRIETHHTVVIADSCYSGAAFVSQKRSHDPNSQVFAKEPSRWMLASGRNEPVNDGTINENSPFTKELLDILNRESNSGIRMGTLVERLKTRVNHNYDQTPIGQPLKDVGDKGGEFIFFPRDNEEERWKEAKTINTLEILDLFINDFRGGKFEKEAQKSIGVIKAAELFSKINIEPTEALCQEYQDNFPEGEDLLEVSKIKFALTENRVWREALESNSLAAFENYLSKYPDGSFKEEADERKREQTKGLKAWQEAEAFYNIQAFENFIKEYPNSEFFEQATFKLKELKAWKHAKASKKAEMLEAFIGDFPESPHLGKAEELLANTAERKQKKKMQLIVTGVSFLVFLTVAVIWFRNEQNKKERFDKNIGIAEYEIRQGNFTKVIVALEKAEEAMPDNKELLRLDNLSQIGRQLMSNDSLGKFWMDEKEWVKAQEHFREYKNLLGKGYETLKSFENGHLDSLFSEHFDLNQKSRVDETLQFLKDKLDHEKVAETVLDISNAGDDLFIAGAYEQALEFYDSAKVEDRFDEAGYLAEKIALAKLQKVLPAMILVPGGKLRLKSSKYVGKEIPSFFISKFEITNEQYAAFLNAKMDYEKTEDWIELSYSGIELSGKTFIVERNHKELPVVGVSWYGANAYAEWVMASLPTESEWEFAASAGGTENFEYSGSNVSRLVANVYWTRVKQRAQKVGKEDSNGLGIYDMSGNVWEWVSTDNGKRKIIKGGSINRKEAYAKIIAQGDLKPESFTTYNKEGRPYTNDLGFRIIRRKK
ncbi:MAG: SUMF1/EgtB/PvdO family nonheme iron enzyme [Bacteroidia bacterium]|nr:SUMF1/EgtB/PvdO family nonheme iron enzyme [Bacteroidia bacterium]